MGDSWVGVNRVNQGGEEMQPGAHGDELVARDERWVGLGLNPAIWSGNRVVVVVIWVGFGLNPHPLKAEGAAPGEG